MYADGGLPVEISHHVERDDVGTRHREGSRGYVKETCGLLAW